MRYGLCFIQENLKRHPNLKFRNKSESWVWKVLSFFAPALKLNYTMIENTLWCPETKASFEEYASKGLLEQLPSSALQVLSHELIHCNQIWLGDAIPTTDKRRNWFMRIVCFYLPYLVWVFPLWFASFRARIEAEAFLLEHRPFDKEGISQTHINSVVYYLTSSVYGWAVSTAKAYQIIDEVITERGLR